MKFLWSLYSLRLVYECASQLENLTRGPGLSIRVQGVRPAGYWVQTHSWAKVEPTELISQDQWWRSRLHSLGQG